MKVFGSIYKKSITVVIFLLIWEIAPRIGLVRSQYIPPFSRVVAALGRMAADGSLWKNVRASLSRALAGYFLSILVGFPVGIALGWNKKVYEYINPLTTVLGQTSPLALMPLFMIIFGLGESSKIAIIFWGCVWRILSSTMSGVSHVDPLLVKAARTMGASKIYVLTRVVIPGAMPEIFPGISGSASAALLMLVGAELLGASRGLGFLITYSQQTFNIVNMYAAILMIAILGTVASSLLKALGNAILGWQKVNE